MADRSQRILILVYQRQVLRVYTNMFQLRQG